MSKRKQLKKLKKQLKKVIADQAEKVKDASSIPAQAPSPWASYDLKARSAIKKKNLAVNPFDTAGFHRPMPGVIPEGHTMDSTHGLAMDAAVIEVSAWSAAQVYNSAYFNGQAFLGYVYLSELAQVPEYRRQAEVLATEATRKWIKLKSASNDDNQAQRIEELTNFMAKLDVQGHFRKLSEYDSLMGRIHLYLDFGDEPNSPELRFPIGNGRDGTTEEKVIKADKKLQALRVIEPLWCYPLTYNSTQPLAKDWYAPRTWGVMGVEVSSSRLLPFVSREVPDLLKAAYQFGGLSLSQMAKPYIDNWLRTRQSVANSVWNYSIPVLSTDTMQLAGPAGTGLTDRLEIFANFRTNQDVAVLNKDKETMEIVSSPLSTLDALQSQSQEHQCSVNGIPVVKLFGIQPVGLNADSEGVIQVWYDNVSAYQEKFFDRPLTTVIDFCQITLWGKRDHDIVHEWLPLAELTEEQAANVQKVKMDTRVAGTTAGIVGPEEARQEMANDPESGYSDINPDDAPGLGDVPGVGEPRELDDGVDDHMSSAFPRIDGGRRDEGEPRRDDDRGDGRREDRAGRDLMRQLARG